MKNLGLVASQRCDIVVLPCEKDQGVPAQYPAVLMFQTLHMQIYHADLIYVIIIDVDNIFYLSWPPNPSPST